MFFTSGVYLFSAVLVHFGNTGGPMAKKGITATGAVAVGPYSHAIEIGGFVYCSGQTPLDSATGRLAGDTIGEQTRQCLKNLQAVLSAAGLTLDDTVKTTVFLTDMADFKEMNAVYAEHFREPYPARSTIGVRELPLGARIEIELVAKK